MDCFYLVLDGICLVGQGVMHIFFTSRLTGKSRNCGILPFIFSC